MELKHNNFSSRVCFWASPRLLSLILLLFYISISVHAQKVISTSEKLKPVWLHAAPPTPGNNTFVYQIAEGEHSDKKQAQADCLTNLSTYIKQTNNITGVGNGAMELLNKDANSSEYLRFNLTYIIEGEKVTFTSEKLDEYWEYITYPDGSRAYKYYTLYAVAKQPNSSHFDEVRFTRKYGARGFIRSMIVPGWGQLYKGNTAKGLCILGGEVALAGGIIVSENLRSSYVKKMKENPQHIKSYSSKADNWENIRNVCIGGAACLYVYNLVDALVSNGRKRTVVKKAKYFTFNPVAAPNYSGVQLTYNF